MVRGNAMKENKGLKEGHLDHIKDKWQTELNKGVEPKTLMDPWAVCEGMKWLGRDGWIRVEEVLIPTEYEEPYPDFYMEIFDQHTCVISHDIYTINEINSYVRETKARLVNNGIKNLIKESTETLKQFNVLYHGSKNGELRKDEKHKYNCLYVTPVFAYAAMYSSDSDSSHGCVFEMKPIRDLNIFDANDEGALDQLKAKVEELNPDNTLVRRIKWEDLKTKDWSTVCFRKDEVRDELLLKAVKALGYDGYINTEWDEGCAEFYARGIGGCGKIVNTTSIGIFDENLLEITDEKYFEDYSDDELFNKCHQADEDLFITFLQDEGFDDYYYDDEEDAKKWAADNLPFLDTDEVNDLVDEYANCYDEED